MNKSSFLGLLAKTLENSFFFSSVLKYFNGIGGDVSCIIQSVSKIYGTFAIYSSAALLEISGELCTKFGTKSGHQYNLFRCSTKPSHE